jgi:hypothetical protein
MNNTKGLGWTSKPLSCLRGTSVRRVKIVHPEVWKGSRPRDADALAVCCFRVAFPVCWSVGRVPNARVLGDVMWTVRCIEASPCQSGGTRSTLEGPSTAACRTWHNHAATHLTREWPFTRARSRNRAACACKLLTASLAAKISPCIYRYISLLLHMHPSAR